MNYIFDYCYKSNNNLCNNKSYYKNNKCYYCKNKIYENTDIFMSDDKQFCSHSHRKLYLNSKLDKYSLILINPNQQYMIPIYHS